VVVLCSILHAVLVCHSWKYHTRRLDPPVGLSPTTRGRSTESNGQRRHRPISTIYDFYFQLAKLAAYRPGPRAAPPSHPTAMGGAHAAICRPRGGFSNKQKLYKNWNTTPNALAKSQAARQWVIGTQKERSDCCSCAVTRPRKGAKLNKLYSSAIGRLPARSMLHPMANMAVRANSVKHIGYRFAAKVQQLERGSIGPKMMPSTSVARRSTYFNA
jgi:hypothetical protein